MNIAAKDKTISCILKCTVVLSAVIGILLSAGAGRGSFMGGSRVFMYFTIQSNILIALICAAGLVLMLRRGSASVSAPATGKRMNGWFVFKFVGTVSITLTGTVFCFVLAPTFGAYAWNVQNILTHVIVPAASIADFFVTGICGSIRKRFAIFVTIPPLLYAVYAGIGYAAGWEFAPGMNYPYFFLNWGSPAGVFGFSKELPFMGCAWWIIAIFVLLLGMGYGYLALLDVRKKRRGIAVK